MQRKFKRIFGSGQATSKIFITGFQTGAMVGGIFGGLVGCYQAVVMRSFLPIPVSILATGTSFGFFMGLGMTIRTTQ
jgi:Reactive mitochondrial oxygen species modulator 1